jgi:hypothetical protein
MGNICECKCNIQETQCWKDCCYGCKICFGCGCDDCCSCDCLKGNCCDCCRQADCGFANPC